MNDRNSKLVRGKVKGSKLEIDIEKSFRMQERE